MKKILVFIFLLLTFASPSQSEELPPPDDFLKASLESLIETLKNDTTLLRDNSKMEAYVSEKVLSQFDMELLSRSIVGEPIWGKASKEEQGTAPRQLKKGSLCIRKSVEPVGYGIIV